MIVLAKGTTDKANALLTDELVAAASLVAFCVWVACESIQLKMAE